MTQQPDEEELAVTYNRLCDVLMTQAEQAGPAFLQDAVETFPPSMSDFELLLHIWSERVEHGFDTFTVAEAMCDLGMVMSWRKRVGS